MESKSINNPLNFVLNLIQALLISMVHLYDRYVYTPIQIISSPFVRVMPRSIGGVTIFTANIVTLSRTFLVIPIAICLKLSLSTPAFWLVILHDYLDHLDGIVAKVHKQLGHQDDPLLGSFLDAFCDKIVNVFALWSILLLVDYQGMNPFHVTILVGTCSLVIGYEMILGLVRVQDYYHCRYGGETPRNLAASMEGKLKEKLESIGISCLCLSYPNPFNRPVIGWIGIICLAFSLRLAHASLAHKLSARSTKEEAEPKGRRSLKVSSELPASADHTPRGDGEEENENDDLDVDTQQQQQFEKKELSKTVSSEDLTSSGKIVYSIGCFDLFHYGHINLIEKMRGHGDKLVVGIHDDESIYKLKNKYPVDPLEKRMENLKKHVDQVYVIPATDPTPYIKAAIDVSRAPDSIYLRGDDMVNFPARKLIEDLKIPVVFVPYTQGVSSTMLRQQLINKGLYKPKP